MNASAMPLLALIVTAVAVAASVIIPRLDRSSLPADTARAPNVAFTVIEEADASPTPSPSPSAAPRFVRPEEIAQDSVEPTRRVGPRRVSVQSGEIEEASTDQELEEEEEEEEQRLEEAEERAKAREDRQNRDD